MKGVLRMLILLESIAFVTNTRAAITQENEFDSVQQESANVLRTRDEKRITLEYCNETQRSIVEPHIEEAGEILDVTTKILGWVYLYVNHYSGPPDWKEDQPIMLPLAYRTYASIMDRKLPQENGAYENELHKLLNVTIHLKRVFQNKGARILITCGDGWLNNHDDHGNSPSEPGFFWDSRPVPFDQKIDGGWVKLPAGKFDQDSISTAVVLEDVPGDISTIVMLNEYSFDHWNWTDHSWRNYSKFNDPIQWYNHKATGEEEWLYKLESWSGKAKLPTMVENNLSMKLIGLLSCVRAMFPGGLRPLIKPEWRFRPTPAMIWDLVTDLASSRPVKAHRSSLNLQLLLAALYLRLWDWSTGVNRGLWEINDDENLPHDSFEGEAVFPLRQ